MEFEEYVNDKIISPEKGDIVLIKDFEQGKYGYVIDKVFDMSVPKMNFRVKIKGYIYDIPTDKCTVISDNELKKIFIDEFIL